MDNLERPESEIRPLLDVIEQEIVQIAARQRESRAPRRIRYLGQVDSLPPSLGQALKHAADLTSDFDDYFLNVAINYSGREEIIDAVRGFLVDYETRGLSLGDAIRDVSPKQIASHLYLDGVPDPDLIGIVPKQPPVREWWHGTEDWVPSMSTRQELEHSAR